MGRYGRDRNRRRNADKNQQWRHQKSAADAEHAGNEADRKPHSQQQKYVDRQVGDREIDFHSINQAVR